ncbi:hypothetical protein THASP1DRAFT_27930 [Thamnocephalis sphaerospora]|uniref:FAD-binding FR-type domain-containing protein n=1 Tax=Thamnocephalis sphaerospora TaxID=78915 RepID=A0A4P9XW79_9FUNG|nr:hypothetical protein THASP1DRAFT_27930 [Thamnocephalis sphaerospora]|eukprot:RKP10292.1 hypothetical protein THASP1DRAFT_27930 [Thamnocephalis sphaerospora]
MADPLAKSTNPAVLRFLAEVAKAKEAKAAAERVRAELHTPTVVVEIQKDTGDDDDKDAGVNAATAHWQRPGVYYRDGEWHMHLPDPPARPAPDECCGGGCSPCVFDAHREALTQHEVLAARIRTEYQRRRAKGRPSGHSGVIACDERDTEVLTDMEDLCEGSGAHDQPLCAYTFRPFRLMAKRVYTQDSWELIGKVASPLPSLSRKECVANAVSLGVAAGQHVLLRGQVDGRLVTKAFTPVTKLADTGTFRLLIKAYKDHLMSRYVASLRVGDNLLLRGPVQSVGFVELPADPTEHVWLFAAGSGITPMYQLLQYEAAKRTTGRDADPLHARITLLYVNKSPEDVWLKEELCAMAEQHSICRVTFIYTQASEAMASNVSAVPVQRTGPERRHDDNGRDNAGTQPLPAVAETALTAQMTQYIQLAGRPTASWLVAWAAARSGAMHACRTGLDREIGDLQPESITAYVCGPIPFNTALREQLSAMEEPQRYRMAVHVFA